MMTNAEKYLKDGVKIEDFAIWLSNALFERRIGVDIQPKAIVDCLANIIKPTLTEDEKVILRNIDPKYEFIGKNDKNFLYIRISADNGNFAERLTGLDFVFPNLFQFIKNGEEYEIKELLKDE